VTDISVFVLYISDFVIYILIWTVF